MQHSLQQQKNGFALLLAIIVSSVVLAIGVSLLQVSINQINLASTARESEIAFQAASAGVECMQYWRNMKNAEFVLIALPDLVLGITCFGTGPNSPVTAPQRIVDDAAKGKIDKYSYEFGLGTQTTDSCIQIDMYIMNAYIADLTYSSFPEGVGTNGTKTCTANSICTVLISTGFNRSCSTYDTDIFSVQRELTLEF